MNFSEKIKKIREEKGMTQTELSKLTGLTQTAISEIEAKPQRRVQLESARKLAKALNVSLDELAGGE